MFFFIIVILYYIKYEFIICTYFYNYRIILLCACISVYIAMNIANIDFEVAFKLKIFKVQYWKQFLFLQDEE